LIHALIYAINSSAGVLEVSVNIDLFEQSAMSRFTQIDYVIHI